jgi:hypothetical protein
VETWTSYRGEDCENKQGQSLDVIQGGDWENEQERIVDIKQGVELLEILVIELRLRTG